MRLGKTNWDAYKHGIPTSNANNAFALGFSLPFVLKVAALRLTLVWRKYRYGCKNGVEQGVSYYELATVEKADRVDF